MKYVVVEKNYETKTVKEVFRCFNKNEARHKVEELAHQFCKEKGAIVGKIYRPSKSGKRYPIGFFMVKDMNFPKIKVYEKIIHCGYLYSHIELKKTITYELVEVSTTRKLKLFYPEQNEYIKDLFKNVLREIEQ